MRSGLQHMLKGRKIRMARERELAHAVVAVDELVTSMEERMNGPRKFVDELNFYNSCCNCPDGECLYQRFLDLVRSIKNWNQVAIVVERKFIILDINYERIVIAKCKDLVEKGLMPSIEEVERILRGHLDEDFSDLYDYVKNLSVS